MSTKHKVVLIFKAGADLVKTDETSKGSSTESKTRGEKGDILWANIDPAVGV